MGRVVRGVWYEEGGMDGEGGAGRPHREACDERDEYLPADVDLQPRPPLPVRYIIHIPCVSSQGGVTIHTAATKVALFCVRYATHTVCILTVRGVYTPAPLSVRYAIHIPCALSQGATPMNAANAPSGGARRRT